MALIVVVQVVIGVITGGAALIAAYFGGEAAGDVGGGVALGAVVLLVPLVTAVSFGRHPVAVWALGVAVAGATLLAVALKL